jgi:hypothetical protein
VAGTSRTSALAVFRVDDKFEFIRSLNRQVGGFRTPENLHDIIAGYLAKSRQRVGAVGHQAAASEVNGERVNRRNFVARCQGHCGIL